MSKPLYKPGEILKKITIKNGEEVVLRTPEWADLEQLRNLTNEIIREEAFISSIREKTKEENMNWLAETLKNIEKREQIYLAAEANGRIIGASEVRVSKAERSKHVGELLIFISKDYRNSGVGSYMMKTLIDSAKRIDLKMIKLQTFENNKNAIQFYRKYGFREVGRVPKEIFYKGKYIDNIIMVKEI